MSLLHLSFLGAVMIAAIAVIRAWTLHKLPKKTFCILWWIVLIRLLVPYSLPCHFSVYSMLSLKNQGYETQQVHAVPTVYRMNPVHTGNIPHASAPVSFDTVSIRPQTVVWLVGMLGLGLYFIISYSICRKRFAESLPIENEYTNNWCKTHRTLRSISIRVCDRISSPLTYGLIHPVILMPKKTDWEDTNVLNDVLTHEYVHIKRLDAVFKLLLAAALCVHWFNPMVWMMYILAQRDIELSCDEAVIRILGSTKASYAMALIQMEEQKAGVSLIGNSFSRNALKERIIAIMKLKKMTPIAAAAAAFFVVGTTVAFATNNAPAKAKNDVGVHGTIANDTTAQVNQSTYQNSNIEWWTYDEYAAWLAQEKVALESMIGQSAWTNTQGNFVWDRKTVDEAIALYEKTLQDIKNGVLISKSIDGSNDVVLASGIYESPATASDFQEYKSFGLTWDEQTNTLYYNGQRVRYFFDGADMGEDGMAIKMEYADREKIGDIDVHTVRQRVDNGDGSYDLMGPLTGLELYYDEEFKTRTFIPSLLSAVSYNIFMSDDSTVITDLDIASTFLYQTDDTVIEEATAVEGTGGGHTFEELFSKYEPFGITYEEAPHASGVGNVYYNGNLVHTFSDVSPSGGAFSFTSSKQGGINVRMIYKNNSLSGVEIVTK